MTMTWTMRIPRAALVVAALAGAFFSFPQASQAAARTGGVPASAQAENPAADTAAARLNKAQYRNVKPMQRSACARPRASQRCAT